MGLFPKGLYQFLTRKPPPPEVCYVIIDFRGVRDQARQLLAARYRAERNLRLGILWGSALFPLILAHLAAYIASFNLWLLIFDFLCMPVVLLRCVVLLFKRLRDFSFAVMLLVTSICANLWGFASSVSYGCLSLLDAVRLAESHGTAANAGVLNWCFILILPLIHIAFAGYRTAHYVRWARSGNFP